MEQPKNDYCRGIHGADGAALWVRIRTMEFPVRPEYPPDMNTDDPIESYLRTFERLRARKRWSMNSVTLRFVALSLGAAATSIDYDRLEEVATELRKRARWTSPLKSEIRYVVAAMILRRGQDPAAIHARVFETRDAFKAHKIPSRGTGATLAALLLALHHEARPVAQPQIERLARVYRRWRNEHRWLTSSSDLPAAALHAVRDVPVDVVAEEVERAYTSLADAGFRRGNQLQLVSHLLAVDPRGTDTGVQRFLAVVERLRAADERVGESRYDEIALLALTRGSPREVVDSIVRNRDRLRAVKPRPDKAVAFTLAAGIEMAADAEAARERNAGDLAALQSIQAIVDAQQAAMIAVIAAVSAGAAAGAAAGS